MTSPVSRNWFKNSENLKLQEGEEGTARQSVSHYNRRFIRGDDGERSVSCKGSRGTQFNTL